MTAARAEIIVASAISLSFMVRLLVPSGDALWQLRDMTVIRRLRGDGKATGHIRGMGRAALDGSTFPTYWFQPVCRQFDHECLESDSFSTNI
jgi:hypothetical protein